LLKMQATGFLCLGNNGGTEKEDTSQRGKKNRKKGIPPKKRLTGQIYLKSLDFTK